MFAERHTAIGNRHDGTKTELVELCMGELAEDGRCKWLVAHMNFLSGGNPGLNTLMGQ
jgi:hypothetical protein